MRHELYLLEKSVKQSRPQSPTRFSDAFEVAVQRKQDKDTRRNRREAREVKRMAPSTEEQE